MFAVAPAKLRQEDGGGGGGVERFACSADIGDGKSCVDERGDGCRYPPAFVADNKDGGRRQA